MFGPDAVSPSFASSSQPLCERLFPHLLYPAWTVGEFFCTICGKKWYCPLCLPSPPAHARLTRCLSHKIVSLVVYDALESEDEDV